MAKRSARRSQTISKEESKSDRFVRVVTPRVGKAVKAIKVIGYCAGSTYEYTPVQVKQITDVLLTAVSALEGRFEKTAEAKPEFAFKD